MTGAAPSSSPNTKILDRSKAADEGSDAFSVFNSEGVYAAYVRPVDTHVRETQIIVDGIHCAGCVRAIERGLQKAGAVDAQVNFGNHRASVQWDEREVKLGDLLRVLHRLGYEGHPYDPATQEALHRKSMRQALARLGVAAFGAGNVMVYSVGLYAGYFYGMDAGIQRMFQWISALLSLPVVFYSGLPFLKGAWGGLRNRRFNMDSLISLGILITFVFSWVTLLAFPGRETYFDSVTMIVFFLLIGRTLETLAKGRSGSITERLMGLQVKWALRLENGQEHTVPIETVRPGDRLLVRPGDAVPTDGVVWEGETELNESALTGESRRRYAQPGDILLGGTVNTGAPVVMESRRVGADTVLARICRLVEQAQNRKAPVQRLADRIASHFVSVILVLAGTTFVFWQWIWSLPVPQSPWVTAISVLIIACPCALGLATPVTVLAGSALAARRGILIKGGEVLEHAAHVTDVVLDKTGTLTTGGLEVASVEDLTGMPTAEWFPLAAALERSTVHPIADALLSYQRQHLASSTDLPTAKGVSVLPGRGAKGMVNGQGVVVGNLRLLTDEGLSLPEQLSTWAQEQVHTLVYVAVADRAVGLVSLSDPLRPDAARAVADLQAMGLTVHLFSGDRAPAVREAAAKVGIADARGEMLPDAKLEALRALQGEGRVVAMVGDGVNDAPALIQADLAMAVGTGSDIALEAAQVILMRARLLGMVETLTIARRTFRVIRQNLAMSVGYNVLAVPAAMAGLVIPLFAALAMSSSSLLVVLNALRLRLRGAPRGEAPAAPMLPGEEMARA